MNVARLESITARYSSLRVAIIGDFCLDRYLEIDPGKKETSIETGLAVHNVINVRSQPGGAGTILNNLVALGVKSILPVGFAGEDGEGYELERSLACKPGVDLPHFFKTPKRRTFTYTKPLMIEPGKAPVELNRLDFKNWTLTPLDIRQRLSESIARLNDQIDAAILLDQVDLADTGVITPETLAQVRCLTQERPKLMVIADSRRSLRGFPPLCFKMNRAEFNALTGSKEFTSMDSLQTKAAALSRELGRFVFITLSEQGILGASPEGDVKHSPSLPLRGEIDIVGAGDAVTANLVAAISSGATLEEALELSMLAASIVVHQLGTTGTASPEQLLELHASIH